MLKTIQNCLLPGRRRHLSMRLRNARRTALASGLRPTPPGVVAVFGLVVGFTLLVTTLPFWDHDSSGRKVGAWMGGIYMTAGLFLGWLHFFLVSPRRGVRRGRSEDH
jgi:hypothetical protein